MTALFQSTPQRQIRGHYQSPQTYKRSVTPQTFWGTTMTLKRARQQWQFFSTRVRMGAWLFCSDACPYGDSFRVNPIYTGDRRNFSWIDNSPALRKACDSSLQDPSICQYGPSFASSQFAGSPIFSVLVKYLLWQSDTIPPAYYVLE